MTRDAVAALTVLALSLAIPHPALGQAYQCTLPQRVTPPGTAKQDGPTRRVPAAGYTLAASWSPEYCKMSGDKASMQCSRRYGRFGFILHGLWPEARKGPPPQWCKMSPRPSIPLIRRHLCMTPSPRLLQHEWYKHGSCMTGKPATYFKVSAILWRSLRWPDADRLSRDKELTAGDLRKAFVRANPAWRTNQVGLHTSRTGWLREVRLCYGRDFMPRTCPAAAFGPPDSARLKIWRGL